MRQAEEAQAVAATARGAADDAVRWANKAQVSAGVATTHANQAIASANAAQASADKAAASARTGAQAASAANAAAVKAAHSAAWAMDSFEQAKAYAVDAANAANAAFASAIAAEKDFTTAQQYYREAYAASVEKAKSEQIAARYAQQVKCEAADFPGTDRYRDCMHHVTDSDSLILGKAMLNGEICNRIAKQGSVYHRSCMAETFNTNFGTMRLLDVGILVTAQLQAITTGLLLAEVFLLAAVLCNVACSTLLGLTGGAEAIMGVGGLFDLWATSVLVDLAAGSFAAARANQGLRGLMGIRLPAVMERAAIEGRARESTLARIGAAFKSCSGGNSFAGETPVLMADRSTRPLRDVRVGDQVLAGDPYSGTVVSQGVTATIVGTGDKDMVDLTVDTDGEAGASTATIAATDNHPFWSPSQRKWVEAGDLSPGVSLLTDSGASVRLVAARPYSRHATVHNLTVAELHTFYVLAGDVPVLAHNVNRFCLKAHEAAGGHTLDRHVGKTDEDLKARNVPRASTFADIESAAHGTEHNIRINADKIRAWLAGRKYKVQLIDRQVTPFAARVYDKETDKFLESDGVETWLVRDPSMPEGYYVETSFPIAE